MNQRINMGRRLLAVAFLPIVALLLVMGAAWAPLQSVALGGGGAVLPLVLAGILVIAAVWLAISTLRATPVDQMINAMDVCQANVMIADNDLNITYLNAPVQAMMRRNEAALRQVLPAFRADALLGANVDVFHRDPQHQRRMLAALRERPTACAAVS